MEIDLENLLVYNEMYGTATKYNLIKMQKVKSVFCFQVSEHLLAIYLDEYPDTPWDALKYLVRNFHC